MANETPTWRTWLRDNWRDVVGGAALAGLGVGLWLWIGLGAGLTMVCGIVIACLAYPELRRKRR